ncbi:flagellar hook-length control protein FliK [Romboutsia maritimum]|uniref:Flagellar hook-length control protein FliK n=1 Tax=Romboutsia maritimum TaxID=2020948 RepID=A0A371IVM8_9FIRM|nr:flagellar hook-length control protein FliK [Romboutsia maritimum]RDY24535.1 flagellar hook-length control protein FliK [Romboutsia maritimum]
MNLNISAQFSNSLQGVSDSKESSKSKNDFSNLFESLGESNEFANNSSKDNKDDLINLELLQMILSNIQNIQPNENIDLSNLKDVQVEGFDLSKLDNIKSGNLQDILNSINEKLNTDNMSNDDLQFLQKLDSLINKEDFSDKTTNNQTVLDENNEIYDLILDKIKNNKFENDSNLNEKSLKNNQVISTEKSTESNSNSNINDDIITFRSLEVKNLQNRSSEDKDTDVLESIIDTGENKNLLFVNSNLDTKNVENVVKEGNNDTPVSYIRQEFMEEDILKTVKYLKTNNLEEMKIKITPRELGEMTINLVKDLEHTKILITVSKPEVFDMVNKNIQDITKHLSDLNINVKQVSVDLKSNNEHFFSDNLNQEFNRRNQENSKKRTKNENLGIEDIEEITDIKQEPNNLNILI